MNLRRLFRANRNDISADSNANSDIKTNTVYLEHERLKENKHPNKSISSRYTTLTFLPLNIYHQLSKPSTLFFSVTLILLCIPSISPFLPYSYMLAFVIVVGISMIKDGMEDLKRHREDNLFNHKECIVLTTNDTAENNSSFTANAKKVMDLNRGDLLYLRENEYVPADCVLLKGVHSIDFGRIFKCSNHCFVDTSNLDGESNLKKKHCVEMQKECCNRSQGTDYSSGIEFICTCFHPIAVSLKSFKVSGDSDLECTLNVDDSIIHTGSKNILLRGSSLRNTSYALCLIVAVGFGEETNKKRKSSIFESELNYVLKFVFVLYGLILAITTIFSIIIGNTKNIATVIFSNYIIYSYLIPLSLYVMLEVTRMFHSSFIKNDENLILEGHSVDSDQNAIKIHSACRNSSVIEDLGNIDYILTDKTGTLTKNSMTLKKFHSKKGEVPLNEFIKGISEDYDRKFLLLSLLICNSVEVLNNKYEGISQEELCILNILQSFGAKLVERDEEFVVICINGKKKKIKILANLEFTSSRQRQSVLIRLEPDIFESDFIKNNKNILFSKGSDQKLLSSKNQTDNSAIQYLSISNEFRSLVYKHREIDDEEAEMFLRELKESSNHTDLSHKELMIKEESLFKNIERFESDISFYDGAVLIEDELQDNVSSTVSRMKENGIKVWMITGDKKETAVCCGRNAGVIDGEYFAVSGKEAVEILDRSIESSSLISTAAFLNSPSIIIYRATPSQKGQIANKMIQLKKHIIGIGDGNNDVQMIRTANVGIGIIGKEGNQASLNADFVIPCFSYLERLVLTHGRFNLIRYSKMTINAFYKNIFFIMIQFFYNFYNEGTGFPIYNDIFMNYYNLFYTSLIPFSIGLFDRDEELEIVQNDGDESTVSVKTLNSSYKSARIYFDRRIIILNLTYGIIQSAGVFALLRLFLFEGISNSSGKMGAYSCESTLISTLVFATVILRQVRQISFLTVYSVIGIAGSISFNILILFGVQQAMRVTSGGIYNLLKMPSFYFVSFSTFSFVYLMDSLFEFLQNQMFETIKNKNL